MEYVLTAVCVTYEICLLAVKHCGDSIQYLIGSDFWSDELAYCAIRQNGCAIKYIPPELQTKELCIMAVKQNGTALRYIFQLTSEICFEAIKINGWAILHVPHPFITAELILCAIEQNGLVLRNIYKPTKELCYKAIQQNGEAIKYVPAEYKNIDFYLLAIKNGLPTSYLPHWINFLIETDLIFTKDNLLTNTKPSPYKPLNSVFGNRDLQSELFSYL